MPNDNNKLAITTNYMCNEFLDDGDLYIFEEMRKNDPRRYQVAGLGNWGISDGLVYDNYEIMDFSLNEVASRNGALFVYGLDFGYSNDPTALFCAVVNEKDKTMYVFDELYRVGMTNDEIAQELIKRGLQGDIIVADSSEPKSIAELQRFGIRKVRKAKKGKDSINNGIDKILQYKMYVSPSCNNFIMELSNYAWDKDKEGNTLNRPIDKHNHLMDAMRYGMEVVGKPKVFSFD